MHRTSIQLSLSRMLACCSAPDEGRGCAVTAAWARSHHPFHWTWPGWHGPHANWSLDLMLDGSR